MDGNAALHKALELFILVVNWMRTTVIMSIGGKNISFLSLLVFTVAWKIFVSFLHGILPGFFDDGEGEESFIFPEGWSHYGDE